MSKLNVNLTQKKLSVNINKTGPKGDAGNDGADGASSYTYVAYASDDQGAGFSLSPAANLTFIAVLTTDTEIASPSAGDFAGLWTEYKSDIQNFDDLTDVTITDGAENDLLTLESGVWVNKTRADIASSILVNTGWQFIDIDFTRVEQITSGSASIDTSLQRRNQLSTGTTADSQAILVTDRTQSWSLGQISSRIDFSKKIVTQVIFSRTPSFDDSDGQCYLFLGSRDNSDWNQLQNGFGFRLDNLDIYALIKNTTETEQLIGTLEPFDSYMLQAESDGDGSVTFSVNTFSDVTMSGAPTSPSGLAESSWKFSAHNVNAGSGVEINIAQSKIWIEQ